MTNEPNGIRRIEVFEPLTALYEGLLETLRTLSERSYSTTLQALTLDVVVVAGLVGGSVALSRTGKVTGTGLLLAFNGAVVAYLASKARAHHREKAKLLAVETKLAELAHWPYGEISQSNPSFLRSFLGGSGLMILCVLLACTCAVSALWSQLEIVD